MLKQHNRLAAIADRKAGLPAPPVITGPGRGSEDNSNNTVGSAAVNNEEAAMEVNKTGPPLRCSP